MSKFYFGLCSIAVACCAVSGAYAQAIQFVAVDAAAQGRNSCAILRTQASLAARLNSLGATGHPPAIDFKSRAALVVTTIDGNAVPNQMGPSASNGSVLLLTFNSGQSVSRYGVFVFSVDGSSAKSYTQCQVSYAPAMTKSRPLAAARSESIHTSSRPQP